MSDDAKILAILANGCINGPIRGIGPTNASIMVVLQAPDGQEDLSNRPCVGRAGKILESLLTESGFDYSSVFITFAVPFRLPKDRQPTPGEVDACRGFLIQQIQQVNPSAIIAMGDTALRSLTKLSGVGLKRGTDLPLHGCFGTTISVWATYLPNFVLRQPLARATVVGDLRRVREGFQQPDEINWQDYTNQVPTGIFVAYDIETDYKGTGEVIQIAFATEGTLVIVARQSSLSASMALFSKGYSLGHQFIGHNSWAFDVPTLRSFGIDCPLGTDTLALAYIVDETQPRGLEALSQKYLEVKGWKEDKNAPIGSDLFAAYNARDALYTLKLFHKFREILGPRIALHDKILLPARAALDACTRRGIALDHEAVQLAKVHYKDIVEKSYKKLESLVGAGFNPKSPEQVGEVLVAEGHILPLTPTGKPATGKGVLNKLRKTGLIAALLEHRQAAKSMDGFITPYEKLGERVHPTYNLFSLTGRTKASNPNTQQLPKDELIRAFFTAAPGNIRISGDYKTIEFYLACYVSGSERLVALLRDPKFDAHRWFAAQFYNKPESEVTAEERQIAKSANFSQLFKGSPQSLIDYAAKQNPPIHLTKEQGLALHIAWHKAYPEFQAWYKKTEEEIKSNGYVESLTGRRRHFGDYHMLDRTRRSECLREGVNFQVQSLAADIGLVALALCNVEGLPITDWWHDSISIEESNTVDVEEVKTKMKQIMTVDTLKYLNKNLGCTLDLPLYVDFKVVKGKELALHL